MKILLDQNISFRIVNKILHIFPNSKQVRQLGLENSTDTEIWEYAKTNGYAIATFDSDFVDIANFRGHPPKIIWLRTGNTSTNNLLKLFLEKHATIKEFLLKEEYNHLACLGIS